MLSKSVIQNFRNQGKDYQIKFSSLEEIDIWKRGCRLAADVYKLCKTAVPELDWGLKDQLRRSAVSIPSNVAEGYGPSAPGEFAHMLSIAKGSCAELKTQIYIAEAAGILTSTQSRPIVKECGEIAAMIRSLMEHEKQKNPKKKTPRV